MEQEFKPTSGIYVEVLLSWALGYSEIKISTLADFFFLLFYIKYLSIHLEQNVILWLISTECVKNNFSFFH